MKNYTVIGLAVGIAVAFAIILGGLPGFLWMLLLGFLGLAVGLHLDGRIDLAAVVSGKNNTNRG